MEAHVIEGLRETPECIYGGSLPTGGAHGHAGSNVLWLAHIDRIVNLILQSEVEPSIESDARERCLWFPLAKALFREIWTDHPLYNEALHYSPRIALFFQACRELSIFDKESKDAGTGYQNGVTEAELFNQLIARIKDEGKTPAFRKRLARANSHAKRSANVLLRYSDALFEKRSRLIVIRLDLSYLDEFMIRETPERASEDLAHLLSNMRGKPSLFADMEGYIWKMECGNLGAVHFHMLFFFNNDHLQNDAFRAEEIGKYWETVITQGRGKFFNCNRSSYKRRFERMDRLGIGRIEYHDLRKRHNLSAIIRYLCKLDQLVRVKTKKGMRTIGKGVHPKISPTRPRVDQVRRP